jgi:hypothetical protein
MAMITFYILRSGNGFLVYTMMMAGVFLFLSIILESIAIRVMEYARSVKNVLICSSVANGVSLLCCVLMVKAFGFYPDEGTILNLLIFYLFSVVIESIVLYCLNPGVSIRKTVQVSVVMNFCTYILIFFFTGLN